LFENNSLKQA